MFVRYLGGGIGHLEQFPPANDDSEVMYEYDDDDEVVMDEDMDFNENSGDENEEGGSEGDDEATEDNEWSGPGESSDEDMGNTY